MGTMHTLELPARRLRASDEPWATTLLLEAYAAEPYYAQLAPDPGALAAYLRLAVRYTLRYGSVYASPSRQAVVLWLPADAASFSWAQVLQLGLPAWALGLGRARPLVHWQQHLDELRHQLLPAPHQYLLALGVRPGWQRLGEGRGLMRATMAALDARAVPCYAHAYNLPAMNFARQLGFDVKAHSLLPTSGQQLPCWAMVRPAGTV